MLDTDLWIPNFIVLACGLSFHLVIYNSVVKSLKLKIQFYYCSLYYLCFFKYLYIFSLRWVFVAACGLSLVVASGGYASQWCAGFSCCRARALGARASVVAARGLSSCGVWAQQLWLTDSRAEAQQLWHTGFVAPWHVGSSRTRD